MFYLQNQHMHTSNTQQYNFQPQNFRCLYGAVNIPNR